MKVFITGATGYLGYHIACQCLVEGHQVLCLRRSTSKSLFDEEQEQRIQWVTINEENWKESVKAFAPDVLIHAAWGGVRGAGRENFDIQKNNILMSNVLFILYPYQQAVEKVFCPKWILFQKTPFLSFPHWLSSYYTKATAFPKYLFSKFLKNVL